jgi:glycosyltransferase involved in cell wall biosynthesis
LENLREIQSRVDISVVVCTYNRAAMLRDTLRSWAGVDQGGWRVELVVVDNNSTDSTRGVVQESQKHLEKPLRYVFEARPGLSFARNKGIEAACGKIIAFVDDDIYFREDWLKEMVSTFERHPEVDCVGGNSIPVFEAPRPDWLTDDYTMLYGSTMSGNSEKRMVFPEHPFGVNMAFRRKVFERVGCFNTRLGRIKKSLLSNEEKELFYRIDRAGMHTHYSPSSVVYHRVPEDRMNQQWILRRVFWQGISKIAFNQLVSKRSKRDLFEDAMRNGIRAIFGPRPYSASKSILFYQGFDLREKMKIALSLGIAKQSCVELLNFQSST